MPRWIPYFLLTFAAFFGGLSALLFGLGILPRQVQDPARHRLWYERSGHLLRWLGPFLILLGVQIPLSAGYLRGLPPWAPRALTWAAIVSFAVFAAATWEPEPPVPWPRTIRGWLGYCAGAFIWSAVLAGALGSLGVPVRAGSPAMFALMVPGLILQRGLLVWLARLIHRHGQRV